MTTTAATPTAPRIARHPLRSGAAPAALWITARAVSLLLSIVALGALVAFVYPIDTAASTGSPPPPGATTVLCVSLAIMAALWATRKLLNRAVALHTPGALGQMTPADPELPSSYYVPGRINQIVQAGVLLGLFWWWLNGPLSPQPWAGTATIVLLCTMAIMTTLFAVYHLIVGIAHVLGRWRHHTWGPWAQHARRPLLFLEDVAYSVVILGSLASWDPEGTSLSEILTTSVMLSTFSLIVVGVFITALAPGLLRTALRPTDPALSVATAEPPAPPWHRRLTEHLLVMFYGDATLEDTERWAPLVKLGALTAVALLVIGALWCWAVAPWLMAVPALGVAVWMWRNRDYLQGLLARP